VQAGVRAALIVILAAVAVIAAGTAGYVAIEGADPLAALYMTVITVTTIGYREVFPLSPAGVVFTIVLALSGIGVIFLAGTEAARVVVEGGLRRFMGLRRDAKMLAKLDRHIVVCGFGRMGRAVVEVLEQRGIPFAVVEENRERCRELAERGVPVVEGDATQADTLRAARIEHARTVIICLRDDAHGVFTVLLARQLNPEVQIIARAVEEGSEERLRLAGADRVINPYRVGGLRLAYTALKPTVVDFLEASLPGAEGDLELAEIRIHEGSELAGTTLAGADVRRRFGLIVVAVKRGEGSVFNPDPNTPLEAGDVLVVLGPADALDRVERASE